MICDGPGIIAGQQCSVTARDLNIRRELLIGSSVLLGTNICTLTSHTILRTILRLPARICAALAAYQTVTAGVEA